MPARLLARRLPTPRARTHAAHLLLVLAAGACAGPTGPTEHPLVGVWRGVAAFTPSTRGHQAARADVAITVGEGGALSGSVRMLDGQAATLTGEVARDGALAVRFDRFTVVGRLHRAPRGRATGSGVQRDGTSAIGTVALELTRP
jgi:hypothetical protein